MGCGISGFATGTTERRNKRVCVIKKNHPSIFKLYYIEINKGNTYIDHITLLGIKVKFYSVSPSKNTFLLAQSPFFCIRFI